MVIEERPAPLDDDPFREMRRHMDAEGRLTHWPAKRSRQLIALRYLATKFTPEMEFNERGINEFLNSIHTFKDPAMLRRELFDLRVLDRTRDGSRYWLRKEA
jgi:hypothetical protein